MSTPWTESGAVIQSPDSEPATGAPPSFSPNLTWSHYRALMRVDDSRARDYYEKEASSANWTVRELERQLHYALLRTACGNADEEWRKDRNRRAT